MRILYFVTFISVFMVCELDVRMVEAKSEHGKTSTVLNAGTNNAREQRPLFANTEIKAKIECKGSDKPSSIVVYWTLTERECWYDDPTLLKLYNAYENSNPLSNKSDDKVITSEKITLDCNDQLVTLPEVKKSVTEKNSQPGNGDSETNPIKSNDLSSNPAKLGQHPMQPASKPIYTVPKDGVYDFALFIDPYKENEDFTATVYIELIGPHGYISATDWPLLPFYGTMCLVYVVLGIIWLIVSFMQWRDLLRIQFWIGGVILLGMLEKAFFYAEYHTLNRTGTSFHGVELAAEFVSCAKRTLARMLVIIMSLGFGIVKPRLGPMLHRVVGVGALYLVLACVESYLRVMRTKTDERNELLVASIPLAVLDTGICWWIFTSLVQTTRTLRLRRNMVKLSLYRHFTNTLIFAVIASVVFMMYAMHLRKIENCTPYWRDIWIDNAFWHILFSVLLLVIMVLWRPTNNNQRYAFTPLLDNPEDEDDDEEEDQFVADTYGVKLRGTSMNGGKTPPRATTTEEDDLRWVEENIPSSMSDPTLPVLDSDEEIISTKFEVSKMQ